ncbi:MAG: histidine phosphatase family protein [Planctomycetales bacterium]|nr:histidine phosphatase family protein [Planctomycetales bacterium]
MRYHPPVPLADACFVLLIRHGATANNDARPPRLQGSGLDVGLSDKGRHQAELTGEALADHPLAAVYSSPLLRARQTAAEVAAPHGLDVTTVDELVECNVGSWEGRFWAEIEESEPEAYRAFIDDPENNPYAGGESLGEVCERVMPAIESLVACHTGEIVAVVAHNVVNRVLLARLIGLPIAKARTIDQQNCGINVLRFRDGKLSMRSANAAFHLDEW